MREFSICPVAHPGHRSLTLIGHGPTMTLVVVSCRMDPNDPLMRFNIADVLVYIPQTLDRYDALF